MKELKKERKWSKNEQKNEKMKLREQKKYELTENERMISTVKPVYNGHPWDLKNMAVMQRIVWKRSVVSRLQAGR